MKSAITDYVNIHTRRAHLTRSGRAFPKMRSAAGNPPHNNLYGLSGLYALSDDRRSNIIK